MSDLASDIPGDPCWFDVPDPEKQVRQHPNLELRPFGGGQAPCPDDAASLHARLLPISAISELGEFFMKDFYYKILPEEDLLFGYVAYVDGAPAGFLAASDDPHGFLGIALRRRPFRLAWSAALSVAQDPARMRGVWKALQRKSGRERAAAAAGGTAAAVKSCVEAELISGGVLADFQRPSTVRRVGSVWAQLIDAVLSQCEARQCGAVRARVSIHNPAATRYYLRNGWLRAEENKLGQGGEIQEFVKRLESGGPNSL